MCLNIDKEATSAFKRRHKGNPNKKITIYKQLIVNDTYSPTHLVAPVRGTRVKPGWFKATGKVTKKDIENEEINGGAIHAYRTTALTSGYIEDKEYYLKCWAYVRDFIAAGEDEICFKQIYIPQEEYNRIFELRKYQGV